MVVALATLPLGAATGEAYACLFGGAADLAPCLATAGLIAAGFAGVAIDSTIYGTGSAGLPDGADFFAPGLAEMSAFADPAFAAGAFADPDLGAVAGRDGAALALLGLAGDVAAAVRAMTTFFGCGLTALFLDDALDEAGLAALFAIVFVGSGFFGVVVAGAALLEAACLAGAFLAVTFFVAAFLAATFFTATVRAADPDAAGFLATAVFFPAVFADALLGASFPVTGFLPAVFLVAAFNGATGLRATVFASALRAAGLLVAGLATILPEAPVLARVVAAAAAALLPLA